MVIGGGTVREVRAVGRSSDPRTRAKGGVARKIMGEFKG